jgi:hypothetical protein
VTYTPTAFGTYSSERFTFFTPGGLILDYTYIIVEKLAS